MIKTIEIENFCTIDRASIDLSGARLIMLVGGSGSGKSSLLGSIFAVLYGSYPDKPDISLYGDVLDPSKRARMMIEMELNNQTIKVERIVDCTEQRSIAYISDATTGKVLVGPKLKDVQMWVANHIMDRNAFLALYYLSQRSKNDMCEITPSDGNKVLVQLLGIENMYAYSRQFAALAKDIAGQIHAFNRELAVIETSKFLLDEKNHRKSAIEDEIKQLSGEITEIEEFLSVTSNNNQTIVDLEKQVLVAENNIKGLINTISGIDVQLLNIAQHLKITESVPCGTTYPKCSFLNIEPKLEHKKDLEQQKIELATELSEAIDCKNSLDTELNSAKNNGNATLQGKRILSVRERQDYSQVLNTKYKDLGVIEGEIERLEAILLKEPALIAEIKTFEINQRYADFISRAFSREGAPALLIDEALPDINKIANDICTTYYVPFRFKIDSTKEMKNGTKIESLNILLEDESGKTRHVTSYSGGERQLAQLVLRFALQEFLYQRFGKQVLNIFAGDELWSAMDSNCLDICFNILSNKSEFDQIIAVSHSYNLVSKFDCVIESSKQNNLTKFEVI
jgi:DNA repair exonuclease SbcCD ATPase subunit